MNARGTFMLIIIAALSGCATTSSEPTSHRSAVDQQEPKKSIADYIRPGKLNRGGNIATAVDEEGVRVDARGLATIHVHDADLRDVAREISRRGRINLLVDRAVDARVTLDLDELPLRDAIDVLARVTGCDVEELRRR